MISRLAKKTAQAFMKNDTGFHNEETYQYAFFIMYGTIILFVFTVICGAVFKVLPESIIFYVLFMGIRLYAGGFHASKELSCDIISALSMLGCVAVIRAENMLDLKIPMFVLSVLSAVCIFALCPLDTPEKTLTDREKRVFRKISLLILLIIFTLVLISFIFKIKLLFAPSCLALILESVLLIAGKIKSLSVGKQSGKTI